MRGTPRWIPKAIVLAVHEALLTAHGGQVGIRDESLLDSALVVPLNLFAYEGADIFELAASYAHALTRNHPFQDGNKRIALTVAGVFLERNGYRLEASEVDAVRATVALSTRDLDEAGFAAWLRESSKKVRSEGKPRNARPGTKSPSPRKRKR